MSQSPRSSSSSLFLIALIPVVAAGFFIWRTLGKTARESTLDGSAFNLSETPEEKAPPEEGDYTSRFEQERDAREGRSDSGLGGLVTERGAIYKRQTGHLSKREQELKFLRENERDIERLKGRMTNIAQKYYKNDPYVRSVDAEFSNMPRYMKLVDQYRKDKNFFDFARGAVGLPEVRKTILKHTKNPKAWEVGIGMMMETLKRPPPKKINDEFVRFMTSDKKMSNYVTDFTNQVMPNMEKMVKNAAPPGVDLSPLSKLGSQITGFKDPLKKKKKRKGTTKKKRVSSKNKASR